MWDYSVEAMVKLAPGVSPARVATQLAAMMARHRNGPKEFHTEVALQPLSDIHFNEKYPDTFSRKVSLPALYGLGAIAAFILLIAAINFINLSTAQSFRRSKEVGVRKVLGGRRGALVLQFLCETLLQVLAAALVALLPDRVPAALRRTWCSRRHAAVSCRNTLMAGSSPSSR